MAIFQLNNTQADTMLSLANKATLPIVAVLGVGIDDDHATAVKLGEFAQNVYDLAGLGFLELWDTDKGKEVSLQMTTEMDRSVQIYVLTNIGKLTFRNTEDRLIN